MYILYLVLSIIMSLGSPHATPQAASIAAREQTETFDRNEIEALVATSAYIARAIPRLPAVATLSAAKKAPGKVVPTSYVTDAVKTSGGHIAPSSKLVRFVYDDHDRVTAELVTKDTEAAQKFTKGMNQALGIKSVTRR